MTLLEVERKFSWKQTNFKLLVLNKGSPRFTLPPRIHTKTFRDVYYDSNDKLSSNGVWVRERLHYGLPASANTPNAGVWEAKKAMPGSSFTHSTCEETQDTSRISQMISKHLPGRCDPEDNFGLEELCQFETLRRSFCADQKFTVVLDETDFGHSTGEVELLAEDAGKAHAEIDAFMRRYGWFFDCSKPKGKLTAYFERFPQGRDYTQVLSTT